MKKIYLAGGWFSPEAEERHSRLYNLLKDKYDVFNPRVESDQTHVKLNADEILQKNIEGMTSVDIIVAIYDGKDTGTIWETGFSYANKKPIIYYSETLNGKPFNLMLAKTGNFAANEEELLALLEDEKSYQYKNVFASYQGEIE